MTAKIIDIRSPINKKNKNETCDSIKNEKKERFSTEDIEIFKSILQKASKLGW